MILTTGDGVQVSDCLVDCSRGPNRASVDANFSEIQSCIYMHAVGYVPQCMANPSRTIDLDLIVAAQAYIYDAPDSFFALHLGY